MSEKERQEELHKHELLSKQAMGEQTLAEIMDHKKKERRLKAEKARLKKEAKKVAIERKRRQDEYKRLKTLKYVHVFLHKFSILPRSTLLTIISHSFTL